MMENEFSRPVAVDKLGREERLFDIEADAGERAALARRFGIPAVEALAAHLRLRRIAGGTTVHLAGHFSADVVQTCVVTLEPVPAHLEEDFELTYAEEDEDAGVEVVVDMDQDDPPEVIVDGQIDIGEATAEHLALALDPFPRAAGARFEGGSDEDVAPSKPNPFAVLAGLKKK